MAERTGGRPLVGMFAGSGNRITHADDAFLAMLGLTRDEFDERVDSGARFSPPEWQDADEAAVTHALRRAATVSPYRKEFVRSDGERVPVLVVAAASEGDGTWTGYAIDLSAARPAWPLADELAMPAPAAERHLPLVGELLRERTRVVSMVESTSVVIWAVDADLCFLGGNEAYHRTQQLITGRRVQAGESLMDIAATDEIRSVWSAWYRRGLAGESFTVRRHLPTPDRTFDFAISPIVDVDGATLGVAVVGTDVTERVAAEQLVAEREARFRSTFSNIADLAFLTDERWRVTFVTDSVERIIEMPPAEVLGRRLWDLRPVDHVEPPARDVIDALRPSGARETMTFRVPLEGGREVWLEVAIVNLLDDPNVRGYAAAARDVTAERQQAEQLATSESLLRIAGRLGRIAGWVVELPSRRLQLSAEAVDLLDLDALDPVRRNLDVSLDGAIDFYPVQHRALLREVYAAAIDRGEAFDVDIEAETPLGRHVCLRVMCEPRVDGDGRVVRLDGAIADVTEQRGAAARLRQQAGLLDTATQGIVARTWDGHITYWNRAAEQLYGWPADDALGRHIADLVDGDDGMEKFHAMQEHLLREGTFSGRIENVDRWGRTLVLDIDATLIRDESGEPTAVFSIASDVSEKVELEERLALSQKLESVGQLTGGIAHDFNNLLTVIIGSAELLADEVGDDARLAPLAAMVLGAAERGAELTNRLLTFARRQRFQPTVVDPTQVIDDLDGLLRRSVTEHVDLHIDHEVGVWPVAVDPGQLEAALVNVAINARDAMPGGGRLEIVTENVVVDDDLAERLGDVTAGDYVRIAVTDTGTGIDPAVASQVFDPFFTTKEPGRGSGLGLSMVYGFTTQSGGHVELTSEPGVGTTVELYLPRAVGEPVATHRHGERSAPPSPTTGSERILVVEDDAMVRAHAVRTLRSLGYDVVEADSGPEALERLEAAGHVDLVFTDVVMPGGMNGAELAAAASEARPGIGVLLTSGFNDVDPLALQAAAPLLPKPYRRAALAAAVRGALGGATVGASSA